MAGLSLVTGVASVALSAAGASKSASASKQQANMDAVRMAQQAALATENANQIEATAKDNIKLLTEVSGINTQIINDTANMNLALINGTSDFNIGMIGATTEFNASSAEGAAMILEQRSELQAQAHLFNADVLELQAQDALEAGNQAERQSRGQYAQLKGQQRARLAANGVALDEGSALRIQADTDYVSDVDADVIQNNSLKAAMGYRTSAVNEIAAASFASMDGKAAALEKRTEAVAARINGAVGIAQTELDRSVRSTDIKMTTSTRLLQERTDLKVQTKNIETQAANDAWAARASATGYTAQGAQSSALARSINPTLVGATSLLGGVASLGTQATNYRRAGVL